MPFSLMVIALFCLCFLLGSIPWGVIISRLFFHTDVRNHGSGNIGTTNAFRALGKAGGVIVFLLDFGKGLLSGALAYQVFLWQGAQSGYDPHLFQILQALAFLACIWGHIFSPWLGFKGGKGIAVAVGCMFTTYGLWPTLLEIALFALLTACTRRVSVGSLAAAVACPFIGLYVFWGNWLAWILVTVAAITVIWAHRQNIARLRAGTESRIGGSKDKPSSPSEA